LILNKAPAVGGINYVCHNLSQKASTHVLFLNFVTVYEPSICTVT